MAQRAPILALPSLQRHASLPRPYPGQKPVASLSHKMRGAECVARTAADLDTRERWVCADLGEEVEDLAAGVGERGRCWDGRRARGEAERAWGE